jgi:ABC-type nitrate/sulfonate/bicarbonate transport system substrate-binding protein
MMTVPDFLTVNRRRLLQSAVASLIAPSVAFADAKPEKSSLAIGIGPDFGTSGSAVIALQKGYFKAQGLDDVELKSFPAGLVQVEALTAGGLDMAMPTQAPILTARANGVPLILFASVAAYNNSLALVIRDGLPVKNPTDLYGLKIGVLKGSGAEMMVNAIIKEYKLDASKIETVNLAPPEQLSSLATAAVDAICVWQPWVYQATQSKAKIVHTGTQSFFAQNQGQKVIVDWTRGLCCTMERFAKTNPITIDAVVSGLAQAQKFIADDSNFGEVNRIFSKFQNQSEQMNAVVIKTYGPSIALDQRFLNDIDEVQDFLLQSGRQRKKIDVADIIYGAPLEKIDPSLVTIEAKWKP